MKVLLSAYACAPGFGSEPEVGLRTVIAASRRHDVWVLFRADFERTLRAALAEAGCNSVHLEPLEPGGLPGGLSEPGAPRPGLGRQHLHYERWQRAAAKRAAELHAIHRFDLVHHVTHAAYWTRAGVASVNAPLVIGPVGGALEVPPRLWPVLGVRGVGEYVLRSTARRLSRFRPPVARALRSADLVIAQNTETVRRLPTSTRSLVHPNCTLVNVNGALAPGSRSSEVLLCGRLASFKGGTLAVRAIASVTHADAVLVVCGTGPDRPRMEALARRLGVDDKVRFEEQVPRADLLRLIGRSGVVLHPSLHEEGGSVVAEALSLGTPVVALNQGGPAQSVALWADSPAKLVSPGSVRSTADALSAAIDMFLDTPPPIPLRPQRPTVSLDRVLEDVYERVIARR